MHTLQKKMYLELSKFNSHTITMSIKIIFCINFFLFMFQIIPSNSDDQAVVKHILHGFKEYIPSAFALLSPSTGPTPLSYLYTIHKIKDYYIV